MGVHLCSLLFSLKPLGVEVKERKQNLKCSGFVFKGNNWLMKSLNIQGDQLTLSCLHLPAPFYLLLLNVFLSPMRLHASGSQNHGTACLTTPNAGPIPRRSDSVGPRWGWEFAFLTSSQVIMMPVSMCRSENHRLPTAAGCHLDLPRGLGPELGTEYALNKYLCFHCLWWHRNEIQRKDKVYQGSH